MKSVVLLEKWERWAKGVSAQANTSSEDLVTTLTKLAEALSCERCLLQALYPKRHT